MNVQTYLFFDGCCEEAIQLYCRVLGAVPEFSMRFKEGPPNLIAPGWEEKIFHATLRLGDTLLNMSDAPPADRTDFGGFALLVHIATIEEAERAFSSLAVDGEVRMPLSQTMWAAQYGIVRDRFGVIWKLQVNNDAAP